MGRNNQLPTPADINNIIDPPREKLSATMYAKLKERQSGGYAFMTDKELAYIRAFEKQELDKL
jgi:hypothetical protein